MRRLILKITTVIWLGFTCFMLWTPRDQIRETRAEIQAVTLQAGHPRASEDVQLFGDTFWHLTLFLVLAALVALQGKTMDGRTVALMILALTGFSLLTEIIQELFVAGRTFQWKDLGLNEVGIVVGVLAAGGWR